ncbi:hypothetical protein VNO77_19575 [Canavalia gladiata]|uniref:Uncharacterized protein n=1 Tax=Canavalia gladiata TaxID=3824 RepID=A0AAN9LN10_CANGL
MLWWSKGHLCVGNIASQALLMDSLSLVLMWPLGSALNLLYTDFKGRHFRSHKCGTVLRPTRIMKDSTFERTFSLRSRAGSNQVGENVRSGKGLNLLLRCCDDYVASKSPSFYGTGCFTSLHVQHSRGD